MLPIRGVDHLLPAAPLALLAFTVQTLCLLHYRQQATTDPLTGLLNRRAILKALESATADHHAVLLLIDIDNFKTVNDTQGHCQGDQTLKAIALAIKDSLRQVDRVGRWGGDEFLVILHRCNPPDTGHQLVNQRIRQAVAELGHSVSIGCSAIKGRSPEGVLAAADTALGLAKANGKNQSGYA